MKYMKYMRLHRTVLTVSGLALLSGLAPVAGAQDLDRKDLAPANPAVENPVLEGQGRLTFASKTQDTGEILDTEVSHVSFLFRNTGAGPLTITQVKPSCGCTVPELSKKTYQAGEQGSIEVSFDPRGKRGAVARNITVYTDSETTPTDSIIVRSLVKPVVITEPMVLPFESIPKGQSDTKEFKIYGRTDDFKVTRATVDDLTAFDIEVVDGGKVEREGEQLTLQIIKVTVKAGAKPDNHRAEITVRTNDERKPIFSLAAVARVMGDLMLNPVRVTLGRIKIGDDFEREFHVTSKAGNAFEIKSANMNTVAVDATYAFTPVDPEVRSDWIVTVKGKATNAAPRFNTQLHLVTDVADEEQVTVQMYGQIQRQ